MKNEKIEISLKHIKDEYVDLDNLSIEALESFITVTSSLKNIAQSISKDVTFTIRKGSAYTCVNGNPLDIRSIYKSMDEAITGESTNDEVTSNLRNIQKELQQESFDYNFKYAQFNLAKRIKKAKKISKKRVTSEYKTEPTIISGFFNSIGGNVPNYHFDYGSGEKRIIDCSINDAQELKDYLYKEISCLVLKKESINKEIKETYKHCSILKKSQIEYIKDFIEKLKITKDLFERLELIYDFAEESKNIIEDIAVILKSYKYLFNDINELKTLLIITKSFKENDKIKDLREIILQDFQNKMV